MRIREAIDLIDRMDIYRTRECDVDDAKCLAIAALEELDIVEKIIDEIEETDWYHIHNGVLIHGANGRDDEPLFRAEDILKICDKYRRKEVD